jgi:cell wall assembly regulator SMI1
MMNGWEWLSLQRLREEWQVLKDLRDSGEFENIENDEDHELVRKDWWHPAWIPLTDSGSGDHHCLDMAPGPRGTRGQIIEVWHDNGERPVYALRFGEWLADYYERLQSGFYTATEEGLFYMVNRDAGNR